MNRRQAVSLFAALAFMLVECVVVYDATRNQGALLYIVLATVTAGLAGYELAGSRESTSLARGADAILDAVDALRNVLQRHIDEHDVRPYDGDTVMTAVTAVISRLTNIERALAFVLVRLVPEHREQILTQLGVGATRKGGEA
jgi:hypothetical protein